MRGAEARALPFLLRIRPLRAGRFAGDACGYAASSSALRRHLPYLFARGRSVPSLMGSTDYIETFAGLPHHRPEL